MSVSFLSCSWSRVSPVSRHYELYKASAPDVLGLWNWIWNYSLQAYSVCRSQSAAHHMYVWDLAWVLSVLVGWQIIVVMASTYRLVLWRSVLFGYWWELCSWVFIKQAVLTNVTWPTPILMSCKGLQGRSWYGVVILHSLGFNQQPFGVLDIFYTTADEASDIHVISWHGEVD